jgi:serine/threonine protein kinase
MEDDTLLQPQPSQPADSPTATTAGAVAGAVAGNLAAPTRGMRPTRLRGVDTDAELAEVIAGWRPHGGLGGGGARFALGERLGQGGQGVVFALRDRDARRTVALKALNGRDLDDGDVARFLHEVQVTAQLEHPGVVPVHDVGVLPDGTAFYTMKRVEGMVLTDWLDGRAGSPAHRFETIQLFLKICDTMAFAHSRGVIHRDLKPRNIMVGTYGEVLVMDWGLAKALGGAARDHEAGAGPTRISSGSDHETVAGTSVGSPAYMSPEQALGQVELVDHRSDVYGLGVILYEMLAAVSPYVRGEVRRTLAQVASGSWTPLDMQPAGRALPRRLVAVVHRAMALRQDERYQHVSELAADLRAFLAGASVSVSR